MNLNSQYHLYKFVLYYEKLKSTKSFKPLFDAINWKINGLF